MFRISRLSVQVCIYAVFGHELFMGAGFHDMPLIHDIDAVKFLD